MSVMTPLTHSSLWPALQISWNTSVKSNRSSRSTPNLVLYHYPCTPSCGLSSVWNHTPGTPGRDLQSLSTRKRCIKILTTPLRLPFMHWFNCIILALNAKLVVALLSSHCPALLNLTITSSERNPIQVHKLG